MTLILVFWKYMLCTCDLYMAPLLQFKSLHHNKNMSGQKPRPYRLPNPSL